jgi:hypothetical protein
MSIYSRSEKPNLVTAIAIMTLISGVVNIFWGLIFTLTVMATLIGVVCAPITALPTILGIFEVIYAAKLLGSPAQPVRPATTLAILEIACILAGNAFSMIVGILALVFYNDLMVKAWFDQLNQSGTDIIPAPVPAHPETAPVVAPEPPAASETSAPETPADSDGANEPPASPGPRKVA